MNDYELDSCDPFIDFLNKDVSGQMNYGINSMLEGQQQYNNFNSSLRMNNMGGATFQPAGFNQEQGVNMADPAIQNMNNFQNINAMAQNNMYQQQQMQAAAQQAMT